MEFSVSWFARADALVDRAAAKVLACMRLRALFSPQQGCDRTPDREVCALNTEICVHCMCACMCACRTCMSVLVCARGGGVVQDGGGLVYGHTWLTFPLR